MAGDVLGHQPEWRWGLWSPNDCTWHKIVQERWRRISADAESESPVIPLKIHQIWLGSSLIPENCKKMMQTWQECHPTWEYKLWTDVNSRAELEECPRLAALFDAARNPAERSDIVRLAIIARHGGLYADIDFECFHPFDSLHHRYSFYAGESNVGAFEVNNALFGAAPEHPLLNFLIEHISRPWAEWGEDDVDKAELTLHQCGGNIAELLGLPQFALASQEESGAQNASFLSRTGPGFFTRGVMRGLLSSCQPLSDISANVAICPPDTFYPLPNWLRDMPAESQQEYTSPATLAVHHWQRTWVSVHT